MSARTTFFQLVESHGWIEIPVIQRDYAQGREDQHIIRDDFLKALHDALCLPKDSPSLPLDLDFVYGSVVNDTFQPLDGQQRLTTLFLLHWYLAWSDGRGEDFRARLLEADRSRFGYEVRPGSRDFINRLADYQPHIPVAECQNVVTMISDQPWFFRSWRLDPTIRSALSMLQRIHEVFRHTTGLYPRLVDQTAPAITFQLLDLEHFDLSDDLYIKMNARGKPLTTFETFKARFGWHLKNHFEGVRLALCGVSSISEFFAHGIDNRWSDFFWPFRDERTANFDDAVMNLIRTVIMVTRAPDAAATTNDLADLRIAAKVNSYAWFHEKSWLDQEMVFALITLLERWSTDPGEFRCYLPDSRNIDEMALFKDIISRPTSLTFEDLARVAGYVQYLVHAHGEINPAAFSDWMRVVSNLSTNTVYNRPDDLRRSFAGLRDLAPWMDDIVRHLAGSEGDVRGFFRHQVAEERIKAHLLGLEDGWPERIDRAEQHPYFRGQIGFLLRLCGVDLDDPDTQIVKLDTAAARALGDPFEHYFACAAQMFDDIVKDPKRAGRLWERALLAVGDFLLPVGRNYSLLTSAQDEAWSWKQLLRNSAAGGREGMALKELWARLREPASFESDLINIVESEHNLDPWREAIVGTPSVYDYSFYKMLRFSEDGGIYLLKRSQMNGRHTELFTYCLHEDLKASPDTLWLMLGYRETTSTDDQPSLSLSQRFGLDDVTFYLHSEGTAGRYQLGLDQPRQPGDKLRAVLKDQGFEDKAGRWIKLLDRAEMKAAVLTLDRALSPNA